MGDMGQWRRAVAVDNCSCCSGVRTARVLDSINQLLLVGTV